MKQYNAVIVGSGPNGLSAAITIAEQGGSVLVLEAADEIGGGTRTSALTMPGFSHDVCSTVHPLAISSPFFRRLPLKKHGLEWIQPPSEFAHPLDDGTAVLLNRSVEETAAGLGEDAEAYQKLMKPLTSRAEELIGEVMQPLLRFPKHPLLLARFGFSAIQSAQKLAKTRFHGARARALFAGVAAHSMIPLSWPGSSAIGLILGVAGHLRGWPIPRGGSRSISQALASYLRALGGEIQTGVRVKSLEELPSSRWTFLDVTPKQLAEIGSARLSESQKQRLSRFQYGMGVYKMDFALSGPIPWLAPECARAATVHLGGTLAEIAQSERDAQEGCVSEKPFTLLAQPSLFDASRAPDGQHVAWAYCHVPNGSASEMSIAIENQIERFAPGFRARILARSILRPADLERYNPNYIGGDISGGAMNLMQALFRPRLSLSPYTTPIENVFLCSSSTPPGPGVHGMCGYLAARSVLN